ncbi:MAG TPA: hypothetical protein VFK70_01420 [Vicinamibacteria bacterium]|nr:hypothetical protein [Vicinamibacteria bacterium]
METLAPETRLSELSGSLPQILFFLSEAQRAFGVALPWAELTRIKTFGELADLIVKARDQPDSFRNE